MENKVRLIAAVDSKLGIANNKGVPWNLSIDLKYFRQKTMGGDMLMGYNTYLLFDKPLEGRRSYVLTSSDTPLKPGFITVRSLMMFMKHFEHDIWVIGGAKLFQASIGYADELYLTRIDRDFKCTKFFPEFKGDFRRKRVSPLHNEDGVSFTFEVWERINNNI